ncbi:hypothetical protein [Umezawaea sp. Da 62-37]|uniref:hypothetical protein n=1 Tax=Umezawaea sp. Da 62-37 TaxID=3075927 RepID=UPI0028F73911|nr:hypothetical protein [Umezawaea sp. Da 62-37]WNV84841.1 hypothetical protein RM788_42875 [Umezawaea sp. Da 62-37]
MRHPGSLLKELDLDKARLLEDFVDLADLEFVAGSMGPKVEACRRFVEATGFPDAIDSLTEVAVVPSEGVS